MRADEGIGPYGCKLHSSFVGAHALMSPQKKEIYEAYKNLAEQGL